MTKKLRKFVQEKVQEEEYGLLVTPAAREWLRKNADVRPEEGSALEESMLGVMRSTANNKRSGRFGASSRGTCLRRQVFAFLGMPQDGLGDWRLHNVFFDGHMRHLKWQLLGLDAGIFTDVEVQYKIPEMRLSVSLDAENHPEGWMFELKGAFSIPRLVPENHNLQVHTCMLASGFERASYLVEDKKTQDFYEWVIHRDEAVIQQVVDELGVLNESVDKEELPKVLPECKRQQGAYKTCPYAADCLGQKHWPEDGEWD